MGTKIDTLAAIEGILAHSNSPKFNAYFLVYQQLKNEADDDTRVKALEWLATSFEFMESDNTVQIKEYITVSENQNFVEQFESTAHSMLRSLVNRNLREYEFYLNIWGIVNNEFFPDEKSKSLALYQIMNTRVVPYFHLDDIDNIAEDEWNRLLRSTRNLRQKIQFILQRKLNTKYQQADALVRTIESVEGKERRVLMATLVDTVAFFERKTTR